MQAITWLGMTSRHVQPATADRVRMVVIHATAGRAPGDLSWLRRGGSPQRPVSVHFYIDKAGRIAQLVAERDIAWHAGRSRWVVDGRTITDCNRVSIGIELENLNSGRDPYPEAQIAAARELTCDLVRRYQIPAAQLVRHLDIAPGRKTDPAGFPWDRFVAEVYADQAAARLPAAALCARMRDLAERAAGGSIPEPWPLREAAAAHDLGMPVALGLGRSDDGWRAAGRAPLLVEVYARDLLYIPAPQGDGPLERADVQRLSATPAGPLRDELLRLLFRAADPAGGFRPDWAFHRYYLEHMDALGAPIGPSHRVTVAPGRAFACQHFALDSLCAPVGAWGTVLRRSALEAGDRSHIPDPAAVAGALREDLYLAKTGRRYRPDALLARLAEDRRLGAPLGRPEVALIDSVAYLMQPFALDVLFCRLPAPDWPLERALPAGTFVGGMRSTLELAGAEPGAASGRGTPRSAGTSAEDDTAQTLTLGAYRRLQAALPPLGGPPAGPPIADLSLHAPSADGRPRRRPELLLLDGTPGPVYADLADGRAAARWHYYVGRDGAIAQLRDDHDPADAGAFDPPARPALRIAAEGGSVRNCPEQRAALLWLLGDLMGRYAIPAARVRAVGAGPTWTTPSVDAPDLSMEHTR